MGLEPSVRHDFIRSFSGSNRFVLSYLLEEVLQQQQPHVRDFLLKTSVLSQLTAPLCSSITGQANSASILAQLVHDNLFTSPLDPDGTWYRYHPLLSESLSARLREDDPALWNELHRRASDWCAHNGHVERAINHAIVSANYELAGELIVQVGEQTWTGGEIATLLRWLDALPPPVIDSRIALRLLYAWVLFLHDRWDDATRQWEDVGRALEQLDEPDKKHCRGRWAAIGAAMAAHRQEADRTLQLTQQSLADLPEDDPNWRIVSNINLGLAHETLGDVGLAARAYNKAADLSIARQNAYLAFASLGHLSEVYMVQGRLFEAQATCERLKQCEELPGGKTLALGANGDIGLALVAYERNDLITAERLFLHALERIWPGGQPRVVLRGRLGLCRLYAAQPAWDKANKQLDLAMVMVTQLQMAAERNLVAATQAWLAHRQGHDIAVTKWKAENQSILQDTSDFRHEIEHRIMAEILIAERRYQAAETLLRALSSAAGRTGRYGRQIAILSLLALALAGQNRADEAESTLKRAISLAEPQGFMRTFIDFGRPLIDLLRRPSVMRAAPSYIKQLLQAYEATIPAELSADKPDDGDEPVLLEKLTPREWEILLLIAAGESNQDIADRLVLSVGTVKGHINHIFSKLDVHSRTAAVAKAHELGLIIL
jgi:LuxR family maltose regulon positive regulatory protein